MILLYRFSETIPIAIGNKFLAATSCSLLQQRPSLSQAPQAPSPKSQVQEAVVPVGARAPQGHHSFMLPHRSPRLSAVLHCAADRLSGGSIILEADWL